MSRNRQHSVIEPRLIGLATRAYPPDVRDRTGVEMLDTALDLARGSSREALRESLALVRGGLKARANLAAQMGTRRLIANACAQGVTVWGLALLLALLRVDRLMMITGAGWTPEQTIVFVAIQVLLILAIAVALLGYDRGAALLGLAWVATALCQYIVRERSLLAMAGSERAIHWVVWALVPLVCYLVMLRQPRTRPRDPRRLVWLAAALAIGLAPSVGATNFGRVAGLGDLGLPLLALLAALVVGLFLVPVTSTLPLAFALALVAYGLSSWTTPHGFADTQEVALRWAMTVAGPLLLVGGATVRLVRARRRVTG